MLRDVDFTQCDLAESVLDTCDLAGATFDGTNLEKAVLTTAYHYSIDPESNKIKKAKFALSGIPGLLHRYNIEVDTTL